MSCFQLCLGDAVAKACRWLALTWRGRGRGRGEVREGAAATSAAVRQPTVQQAGQPESLLTARGQPLTLLEAQEQARLLETQAARLKATIRRRRGLKGESGPILGHYERVLAGLEGEIASLGGTARFDAAAGASCSAP